jgi:hypothetical protein
MTARFTDIPRLSTARMTLCAMQALHPDAIVYRHPTPGGSS